MTICETEQNLCKNYAWHYNFPKYLKIRPTARTIKRQFVSIQSYTNGPTLTSIQKLKLLGLHVCNKFKNTAAETNVIRQKCSVNTKASNIHPHSSCASSKTTGMSQLFHWVSLQQSHHSSDQSENTSSHRSQSTSHNQCSGQWSRDRSSATTYSTLVSHTVCL